MIQSPVIRPGQAGLSPNLFLFAKRRMYSIDPYVPGVPAAGAGVGVGAAGSVVGAGVVAGA